MYRRPAARIWARRLEGEMCYVARNKSLFFARETISETENFKLRRSETCCLFFFLFIFLSHFLNLSFRLCELRLHLVHKFHAIRRMLKSEREKLNTQLMNNVFLKRSEHIELLLFRFASKFKFVFNDRTGERSVVTGCFYAGLVKGIRRVCFFDKSRYKSQTGWS